MCCYAWQWSIVSGWLNKDCLPQEPLNYREMQPLLVKGCKI